MAVATTPSSIVLLTRLSRQVYRRSSEEILGMSLKQFGVLAWLPDPEGIAQQELGAMLCLDPNNLTLLLNPLENEGWIERRRDPADRRRHLVFRTEAGRRRLHEAEEGMGSVEHEILGRLNPAERDTLRTLLARALDVD